MFKQKNYLFFIVLLLMIGCNQGQKSVAQKIETKQYLPLADADTALFRTVQQQTFQYFWDGAEPNSGMGRERFHADNIYPDNDKHVVTSGGSGFGVMGLLVGIERGFVTREEGRKLLEKIIHFLETTNRFHVA